MAAIKEMALKEKNLMLKSNRSERVEKIMEEQAIEQEKPPEKKQPKLSEHLRMQMTQIVEKYKQMNPNVITFWLILSFSRSFQKVLKKIDPEEKKPFLHKW